MDRKRFREFLHDKLGMTEDIIMDRIFKHFNKISTDDINMEEWITGFNVFLKGKGSLKIQKMVQFGASLI